MPEPVTIEQARAQCGIDAADTTFDTLLTGYISAARDWVERYTGHILMRREMTEALDAFPSSYIELPWRPIAAVGGIEYTDSDNAAAEFTGYTVISAREPVRIKLASGYSWPAIYDGSAITVTFTAGYADGEAPPALLQAMLLLIGHWFMNREAVAENAPSEVPFATRALCDAYRVPWL